MPRMETNNANNAVEKELSKVARRDWEYWIPSKDCGRLCQAMAGCGRLWQAVAGCGRLWQAVGGGIKSGDIYYL